MIAIARLDSRALVRVTGPDARPFLHNLLTQDTETLKPGELRFGALLTPQGRLLFDLFLWGLDDGVLIDVAADQRPALIQRLGLYRLRAHIEITTDDRAVHVSWPQVAPGFQADPRLPALGGRGHGPETTTADVAGWHAHRLALGVPDSTDLAGDALYAIDANFDLLNGIDFGKGCFIGQETTSRMKRRGTIRNRILPLTIEGGPPIPGSEVLNGELRAGQLLGGHGEYGLALMRLDRLEGGLTIDGRAATVIWPGWLPPNG